MGRRAGSTSGGLTVGVFQNLFVVIGPQSGVRSDRVEGLLFKPIFLKKMGHQESLQENSSMWLQSQAIKEAMWYTCILLF